MNEFGDIQYALFKHAVYTHSVFKYAIQSIYCVCLLYTASVVHGFKHVVLKNLRTVLQ